MKLLIVDDTKSPHVVIERLVEDSSLPFTDILHAFDGKQCIECIHQHFPEVVILDMEMPLMDGIEVLHTLPRDQMPLIIVLSAYSDFTYVQQAIRKDTFDYLLKPIDSDALLDVLGKAVEKLQKEMYEDIIKYLAIGGEEYFSYRMAYIDRFSLYTSYWKTNENSKNTIPRLDDKYETFVINIGNNEFLMLHQTAKYSPMVLAKYIMANANRFQDYQIKISSMIINCPIDIANNIEQFRSNSSKYTFFYGQIPDIKRTRDTFLYSTSTIQNLLEDITPDNLNEYVDRLFDEISRTYHNAEDFYSILKESLTSLLKYTFNESSVDVPDSNNIQDLKASFLSILRALLEKQYKGTEQSLENYSDVEMVKKYINQNYMINLTLDEVASSVYMSKFNLCRKFKLQYGIGIWNYIKQIRLSKACSLLKTTNMKVSKIASEVGFNDSSYFSNVFRMKYGMSPQSYRKKNISTL